jgi:hypothetical protein
MLYNSARVLHGVIGGLPKLSRCSVGSIAQFNELVAFSVFLVVDSITLIGPNRSQGNIEGIEGEQRGNSLS